MRSLKYLFLGLLFLLLANSKGYPQSFKDISKLVMKSSPQKLEHDAKLLHKLRMELYNLNKLSFLEKPKDTIWILESLMRQSGATLGRIWNKSGFIDYAYDGNTFDFTSYIPFTKHIVNLIENWDVSDIKTEAKEQKQFFDLGYIYASRVVREDDNVKVDTISFVQLFKWGRD